MTGENVKPKLCPFCKTDEHVRVIEADTTSFEPMWEVICFECGVSGPTVTSKTEAIKLWNRLSCAQKEV